MAHFAELDENNKIINVIVVHNNELIDENGDESEQKGIDFCVSHYGGRWIQTYYNSSFRLRFAGINYVYDELNDVFISPKPYGSWILNTENYEWEAPIPYPASDEENPRYYEWNEEILNWEEIQVSE